MKKRKDFGRYCNFDTVEAQSVKIEGNHKMLEAFTLIKLESRMRNCISKQKESAPGPTSPHQTSARSNCRTVGEAPGLGGEAASTWRHVRGANHHQCRNMTAINEWVTPNPFPGTGRTNLKNLKSENFCAKCLHRSEWTWSDLPKAC